MGNELLIGDNLRQARLNKNISLDELQQKTKIQKRYLEAIEKGHSISKHLPILVTVIDPELKAIILEEI